MFLAVMPSLRTIRDPQAYYQALRVLTSRFNIVGWSALVLLALTGIDNIVAGERAIDAFDYDYRFAWILTIKLALVAATILLTTYHVFGIGPRMMSVVEAAPGSATHSETRLLRRLSIAINVANLLIAIAILFLAALLRQPFAFERV